VNDKKARRAKGMRIYASWIVLTKASGHASLLAPKDPRKCLGRSCAPLKAMTHGVPAQMLFFAIEAFGDSGGQPVETK
jgi:hypothetical protein